MPHKTTRKPSLAGQLFLRSHIIYTVYGLRTSIHSPWKNMRTVRGIVISTVKMMEGAPGQGTRVGHSQTEGEYAADVWRGAPSVQLLSEAKNNI